MLVSATCPVSSQRCHPLPGVVQVRHVLLEGTGIDMSTLGIELSPFLNDKMSAQPHLFDVGQFGNLVRASQSLLFLRALIKRVRWLYVKDNKMANEFLQLLCILKYMS